MDHSNPGGLSKPEHDIFLIFKGQMSKHNLVCNDQACYCSKLTWLKKISP
jgi:hypothetical protein